MLGKIVFHYSVQQRSIGSGKIILLFAEQSEFFSMMSAGKNKRKLSLRRLIGMEDIEIKPGLVVVAKGKVCKVEEVLSGMKFVVTSQCDKKKITVSLDDLEFIPATTNEGVSVLSSEDERLLENASFEEIELAQDRFSIIEKYLARELSRSEAIQKVGVSKGHFHLLLRRFDREAGFHSFLPMKKGVKKNSTRLSAVVESFIQESITTVYKGKAASISNVWRDVEKKCIKGRECVPSLTAVRDRLNKRNEKERYKSKYGAEAAAEKFDAKTGKSQVSRPLEAVQMDHTLVDIILVDDVHRKPLGRPWLTVIIDMYSRVILGYYLSLHAPSTLSVACAIYHAALPKHAFLKRFSIDESRYPFYGVPKIIRMDNAREFKTEKFQRACQKYRIKPEWRPPGRKHYGGHVERLIGTFMTTKVHFLPGATYSNVVKRRGYDSEKSSALTFKEFTRWFAGEVCLYHGRKHSTLNRSPSAQWNSFFGMGGDNPAHPPLVLNPFSFKLDFMPEEVRRIGTEGIKLHGGTYWDNSLRPFVGRKNVVVKYDPFAMGKIWVLLDKEYFPVPFSDITKSEYTYEEYRASVKRGLGIHQTKAGSLEDTSLVGIIDANQALVVESVKLTKRARKKQAAKAEYFMSQIDEEEPTQLAQRDVSKEGRPDYSKKAEPFRRAADE